MTATAPQLTQDEIIRWFRRFRYDHEFRDEHGSRMIPLTQVSIYCGIPRQEIYRVIRREIGLTESYRVRLSYVIQAIQDGLRWRRRQKVWAPTEAKFNKLPVFDRPKHRVAA